MRILNSSLLKTLALGAGLALGSASLFGAQATVSVNFGLLAQSQGEGAVGYHTYTGTDAIGFNLLNITSNSGNSAYMDSFSGGKPGGLGACTTINGSGQCDPSNDDNLSIGEQVTISLKDGGLFNWQVTDFRDDNHNDLFDSRTLTVGIDGATLTESTFADELSLTYLGITSITYGFGGYSANNYYLEIAGLSFPPPTNVEVPEPGALVILGLGLAGIGLARRKRAA